MKKRSTQCSKRYGSSGLTLIEVVVSMALLSTLLVVMLKAHSSHVRQINLSDKKQSACQSLDLLIADYFEQGLPLPAFAEGELDGSPDCTWRATEVFSNVTNQFWRTRTVRFEVFCSKTEQSLVALELLDKQETEAYDAVRELP